MSDRATGTRMIVAMAAVALATAVLVGCGGGSSHTVESSPAPKQREELGMRQRPHRPAPDAATLAATPRCVPSDLVVWHGDEGSSPVGPTTYTTFTVTNLGRHACTLSGYPSLQSFTVGGRLLERSRPGGLPLESSRPIVRIAAGGSAHFRTSWEAAGFADPQRCRPTYAARYRVDLPGPGPTRAVPFPVPGRCTGGSPGYGISVGRFEASGPSPDRPPRAAPRLLPPRRGEHLPRCRPAKLVASLDIYASAGAAALTSYTRIAVTNLSDRACVAAGTPTVVAVDTSGRPIGPPARKSPGGVGVAADGRHVGAARIDREDTAYFMLAVSDPGAYGPGECAYETAAGLRITLPGASGPQFLPMPIRRCRRGAGARGQISVGRIE